MDFSIIICAYNPEKDIFQRLLNAVLAFNSLSPAYEVIIIDNNSYPALARNKAIKIFLEQKQNTRLLVETKAGLTAARIAGIKHAKYDWIIFFDDDNEPNKDYLLEAKGFIERHPNVGICGPGKVSVEFIHSNKFTEMQRIKKLFQYRDTKRELVDNNLFSGNYDAFPFGTGMIVRKNILNEYCEKVEDGIFTFTDRTGKSLSSAGDTQILYLALKKKYFSGTSENLKLNHIISEKKTTRIAIMKLLYSLNMGQIKAFNEVFPENAYRVNKISSWNCLIVIYHRFIIEKKQKKNRNDIWWDISESLGMHKASIVAGNFRNPFFLKLWEKYLGI